MRDGSEATIPYKSSFPDNLKVLRSISICLLALIVLVGFIEGVLRFALGFGNPVLIAPDPYCEYILKPDQHIFRFFAHTDTNHLGMRSDEVPAKRSPDTLRLMLVGDSIVYGTSRVDQHQIFSEILRHDLPSIVHEHVEVLNASAGGWAIENELSYIRSRGIFNSDVVLLVLNNGDLTQSRATIAQSDSMPIRRDATAIGELYSRLVRPLLSHGRALNGGSLTSGEAYAIRRSNLADLEAFRALVASQHAQLVIVYAPFRRDIPTRSADSAATLYNWASAHNVSYLDLTSAESLYPANAITLDGTHFNTRGHQLVAKAIERSWFNLVKP